MLKPVILAAVLATVGGLSLQPALAQGVQAQRNVCAEATSDCSQTNVDDNAGTVREKNDVNRREVGSPRSSKHLG